MPGTGEALLRLTPEEREKVLSVLRREDLSPRVRERLEMVKAADLGRNLEEVAAWSGRTPRTVRRWLSAFAAGGIAALADAPRSGRPARADAAYLRALEEAVETPPRELGLGFDVWTSERLGAYLEEKTGVRIAAGWLRALLARRRFVCGHPKHTLDHLQETRRRWPPAKPSWRKRGKKVEREPERYELHYQDETHLETNPYTSGGSGTGWASSRHSRRQAPISA